MLRLESIGSKDSRLLIDMSNHYSQPKGFVGRRLCYAIMWNDIYYGGIVGGSATRFLPGRFSTLNLTANKLNNIVNNTFFFHVRDLKPYPTRNFLQKIIKNFRQIVALDWENKYRDKVLAFETLVELPRTGECYKRDGWIEVGITKGFTCKRIAGKSTDSWTGRRVWDTTNLKPKKVLVRLA